MAGKSILLRGLVLLLLAVIPAFADGDNQIVPGERIGNIHLGDNFSVAQNSLGNPDSVINCGNSYCYVFNGSQIVLMVNKELNTINGISTSNRNYHLDNGLGVNSTEDDLDEAYEKPDEIIDYGRMRQFYYRKQGVMFQIYDRQIKTIGVGVGF